jgi:hypothetical protein
MWKRGAFIYAFFVLLVMAMISFTNAIYHHCVSMKAEKRRARSRDKDAKYQSFERVARDERLDEAPRMNYADDEAIDYYNHFDSMDKERRRIAEERRRLLGEGSA